MLLYIFQSLHRGVGTGLADPATAGPKFPVHQERPSSSHCWAGISCAFRSFNIVKIVTPCSISFDSLGPQWDSEQKAVIFNHEKSLMLKYSRMQRKVPSRLVCGSRSMCLDCTLLGVQVTTGLGFFLRSGHLTQ